MFDELQDETTKRILELDDTEFQKVDFVNKSILDTMYQNDIEKVCYPECQRKKLLIDPDKLLFDVIPKSQYDLQLSKSIKIKLNSELKPQNLLRTFKMDNGYELVIAVRKGAIEFLKKAS